MLLSVIVPTYNNEKYITKCIKSIEEQELANYELIVVNDGSKDSTAKIIDEIALQYNNITIIHQKNKGANSARRAGLSIAKGDYIMFVDGDDWIEKNCFAHLCEIMTKNADCELICFGMNIVTLHSTEKTSFGVGKGFYYREDIEKYIFPNLIENEFGKHISCSLCGKVFKAERVKRQFYETNMGIKIGEDAAVVRPYVLQCNSIQVIEECYYYYNCANVGSTTFNLQPITKTNIRYLVRVLTKEFGYIDPWKSQIRRNIIHNLFVASMSQFNSNFEYKEQRKRINELLNLDFGIDYYKIGDFKSVAWVIISIILKYRIVWAIKLCWTIRTKRYK